MIKPWLDPLVTAKIFVLRGPHEYEPALFEFIGKENLPANYGGDLPELTPDVHPYVDALKIFYPEVAVTEPTSPSSGKRKSTEATGILRGRYFRWFSLYQWLIKRAELNTTSRLPLFLEKNVVS